MPILGSPLVHGPFDLKDKKNMGQMVYQTVGHLWSRKHVFYLLAVADLRGGAGDARPPRGSKFFQFHAVFGKIRQICMLAPPPGELAPPPQGNPGSATDWVSLYMGGGARIVNGSYPTVRKKNVMPDTVPSVERMRIY